MNFKKITVWLVLGIIALIAIYDLIAISNDGTEASISHLLIVWSHRYPTTVFCFGFVMGHLFWPITITPTLEALKKAKNHDAK